MVTSRDRDGILESWVREGNQKDVASTIRSTLRWGADILRPSIMTRSAPQKQIRRLAYLDGLRGFAAFLVYWQHHQLWPLRSVNTGRILESGYGVEGQYRFATLPIVRTFFTGGHFAVGK